MSSWAIVALVTILIGGVVQTARARAGIITNAHTGDTREQRWIAAEIVALRGIPAAKKEEPEQ